MRTRVETHTLQLWPSGNGYEYRSDDTELASGFPGLGDNKQLRKHSYNSGPPEHWRKGTADEWAAILVELRVERYIDQEILKCDSMLVSDLLSHGNECSYGDLQDEWSYDQVANLYPDPSEWGAGECRVWFDDHGLAHDAYEDDESLRQAVLDNAEPAEIYEWWSVTEWFAGQLTAIGQPVLDNAYGYWWGRTCTGQAMKIDGTLQEIARKHA